MAITGRNQNASGSDPACLLGSYCLNDFFRLTRIRTVNLLLTVACIRGDDKCVHDLLKTAIVLFFKRCLSNFACSLPLPTLNEHPFMPLIVTVTLD